ncbi:hypothetical protein PUN28_005178 [Cardiocondyla obscurior]|uniref:Uncharacterized protein n=1 Tax=Cardiocondyla obscurior TaxID=286306 RepID=A0AAW2GHE4_9HYME
MLISRLFFSTHKTMPRADLSRHIRVQTRSPRIEYIFHVKIQGFMKNFLRDRGRNFQVERLSVKPRRCSISVTYIWVRPGVVDDIKVIVKDKSSTGGILQVQVRYKMLFKTLTRDEMRKSILERGKSIDKEYSSRTFSTRVILPTLQESNLTYDRLATFRATRTRGCLGTRFPIFNFIQRRPFNICQIISPSVVPIRMSNEKKRLRARLLIEKKKFTSQAIAIKSRKKKKIKQKKKRKKMIPVRKITFYRRVV